MIGYLFVTYIVIFCIQLIYQIVVFSRFSFSKSISKENTFSKPVSVLICAKNESTNLQQNLFNFINQSYSNFELILINDCSFDNTLQIMEDFKSNSETSIKIVNVVPNEQFWGSKKYALTLGIKAATNEHLLFIDADCIPTSKHWVSEMVNGFNSNKQIVLGYGPYKKIKKSFLNKIIRFETLLTAIQYFSYAKIGIPYMGVGRNLAYTKSLFFSTNGFANHMHLKSGDDDLFINQVATSTNTNSVYSKESYTESIPKKTFKEWFQQKRRHVSTASHYKFSHKFLLGLFYFTQFTFWLLSFILLFTYYNWEIILAIIISRVLIQYLIIGYSAKKLNEKDLVLFSPFFELFLILSQLFIFIKNLVSKPTHW